MFHMNVDNKFPAWYQEITKYTNKYSRYQRLSQTFPKIKVFLERNSIKLISKSKIT